MRRIFFVTALIGLISLLSLIILGLEFNFIWIQTITPVLVNMIALGVFSFLIAGIFLLSQILFHQKEDKFNFDKEFHSDYIIDRIKEIILTTDDKGIIQQINARVTDIFGYAPEEILGKTIKMLIPMDKITEGMEFYQRRENQLSAKGLNKNGKTFPIKYSIEEVIRNKEKKFIFFINDLSDIQETEYKLQTSEDSFRLAFDLSPIGMALSSSDARWVKVNAALCQMLGYSEQELLQMDFKQITYVDDLEISLEKVQKMLDGKLKQIQLEKRYYHRDGHIVWALVNIALIRDIDEKPLYFIAQVQDITKQKQTEDQLSYQVHHDSLTGLSNRIFLEKQLNSIIMTAQKNQKRFSIFFLDFDKFKQINDSLGHAAGDQLLKTVAERLLHNTRKEDIIARIGGDEFVLVLLDLPDYEAAAVFAERIMLILQAPIRLQGHELFVTTSIGISFYPMDGIDYGALIKNADDALYRAKQMQGNNYQFCVPSISKKIKEEMSFEYALQNALDRNEFKMYYLPQINIATQQITGIEALLRWENRKYGTIMPDQIIPVAEKTGLIIPLSEWIVKTACNDIKKQFSSKYPKLRLAINISAKHFIHKRLIDSIEDALAISGFDPNFFSLEINESLMMDNFKTTLEVTNNLKQYGIKIIIDNFGVGYSSLSFLQEFPIDAIKIDKSIIQNKVSSSKNSSLVTGIIALAKSLGIKVFAAGVETREQYEFLARAGCDEIQGYYICNPALAEELTKFLDIYQPGKLTIS